MAPESSRTFATTGVAVEAVNRFPKLRIAMSAAPAHSALIAAGARRHLGPLGLTRKGRSRQWIDDHGWWLVNVEFQPSSFGKGSYLNVGAQFLWRRSPAFSFEVAAPGKPWIAFESPEQFGPEAEHLAVIAADHVKLFRARFTSLQSVASYFEDARPTADNLYSGAVALGLLGKHRRASALLAQFLAMDDDRDWAIRWKKEAHTLVELVADERAFRAAVTSIITEMRSILKLPPLATYLDLHA